MEVYLKQVPVPERDRPEQVPLTDETMAARLQAVLAAMRDRQLDALAVYCDVEHGQNFMYLTGFFTRFEEGLLVLHADGRAYLMLGNENLNKCAKSRLPAQPVHVPLFSLPDQPQRADRTLRQLLGDAGIRAGMTLGLAGWKLFTGPAEDTDRMFDVPAFLTDAIRDLLGPDGTLKNAAELFIGPEGVRRVNNANEVAHYAYGAALASDGMLDAMDALQEGVSETELGGLLNRCGQHNSVVTIAAAGPRFVKANLFPTENTVKSGDPVSLTVGYAGGLSSRAGYAARRREDLPPELQGWQDRVAAPYFAACALWLSCLRIGMTGGQLYDLVDMVLPRSQYGWGLCPGHLTAEEEWLCSPIYEGSQEELRSGMLLQLDIIPSVPGFGGVSAETTVCLADEDLQRQLREDYPALWQRTQRTAAYMREVLGIALSPDLLPMCASAGYLRPYLLDHTRAFVCR